MFRLSDDSPAYELAVFLAELSPFVSQKLQNFFPIGQYPHLLITQERAPRKSTVYSIVLNISID